jgi:hypothetical protein
LIQEGFDTQAKNLLRSIDEHVEAIYYLSIKPEVAEEFVSAQDEKSANQFWHNHIKRSRKIIDDAIKGKLKSHAEFTELREFRFEERKTLSMAHHPSYVAATVSFFVPYDSVNVTKYIFGLPSEASYRTGRLLFYILGEMAMFLGFLNDDMKKIISRRRRGLLQRLVRQGQRHLGRANNSFNYIG